MNDAAIVTGASSGIGLEISKMLCRRGYEVFGIGRNFDPAHESDHFHPIVCDILDTDNLCDTVKKIAAQYHLSVLVNNAGTAYYGLHEELNARKIRQMVRTNLEAPMILTCQLLRTLKKNRGYIINRSLFDEARKYGVRVVTISPDMTQTNLYRNADFKEGEELKSYLLPEEVACAVEYVLNQRDGLVISDITLKPQLHRIARK